LWESVAPYFEKLVEVKENVDATATA